MKRLNRNTEARIEPLEGRRMLNAATLKHGLLTVYCTAGSDNALSIYSNDPSNPDPRSVFVVFGKWPEDQAPTTLQFSGKEIKRIRVFGDGNNISLDQTRTPNLTDVAIYTGDGGATVQDYTEAHRFNRNERVSIFGGNGNDDLIGGNHTVLIDGGAGNDTLSGGEAGAILNGDDGDDLLSANPVGLVNALEQTAVPGDALGSVVLNGGAGDDVIIGNSLKLAGVSDSLSGGGGSNSFYAFASDQISDINLGSGDQVIADNNIEIGNPFVVQTAKLTVHTFDDSGAHIITPPRGLGLDGPYSNMFIADDQGTLNMLGSPGDTFSLGTFLNYAGYPVAKLGIPSNLDLNVNGFETHLQGNQIAGYQINDGDAITLTLTLGD